MLPGDTAVGLRRGILCCAASMLVACDGGPTIEQAACSSPSVPIARIQGDGAVSPLLGRIVDVRGVVTHQTPGGIYLESTAPDDDPGTSEGLFLDLPANARSARPGALVAVRGAVAELGSGRDTQTALTAVEGVTRCADEAPLPLTGMRLPADRERREALENMRVTLESRSMATDVYRLGGGELTIAANAILPAPTEVAWPGADARRRAAQNRAASLRVRLPAARPEPFPIGTELLSDSGVLGHDERGPVLLLTDEPRTAPPRLNPPPPRPPGALRVVSLNLHNYFNGDGLGAGFPTPRGAETRKEFAQQRARLEATLTVLDPDLVAVMELENDGFGPLSAASSFLSDLRAATGAEWAASDPGLDRIGTDEITVGLFHRPDRVEALGAPLLLDAAPFDLLNRTPVAQLYRDPGSGSRFLVTVNHFKSKGSCPDHGRDQDQKDGQACWNAARLAAARSLAPWVRQLATAGAGDRALVLGDLNAYRMEDPVQHLLGQGFRDLTAGAGEGHEYSFVYFGQSGTLDHALATPKLAGHVARAQLLNINAGYPPGLSLEPPWLRSSDHDPVLVDLVFSQSATRD